MRLTGISNHGLLTIAVLVAILWSCIIAERAMVRRARQNLDQLLPSERALSIKQEQQRRRLLPPSPGWTFSRTMAAAG